MIIKNMFEILKKREKIRFSATDPLLLKEAIWNAYLQLT